MKNIYAVFLIVLVSSSMLVSMPAFGKSVINVEHCTPVIVKVFDAPVGIESEYYKGKCVIRYGIISGIMQIKPGNSLRIKVIGDDDIIVLCNGEKGITISRE